MQTLGIELSWAIPLALNKSLNTPSIGYLRRAAIIIFTFFNILPCYIPWADHELSLLPLPLGCWDYRPSHHPHPSFVTLSASETSLITFSSACYWCLLPFGQRLLAFLRSTAEKMGVYKCPSNFSPPQMFHSLEANLWLLLVLFTTSPPLFSFHYSHDLFFFFCLIFSSFSSAGPRHDCTY